MEFVEQLAKVMLVQRQSESIHSKVPPFEIIQQAAGDNVGFAGVFLIGLGTSGDKLQFEVPVFDHRRAEFLKDDRTACSNFARCGLGEGDRIPQHGEVNIGDFLIQQEISNVAADSE